MRSTTARYSLSHLFKLIVCLLLNFRNITANASSIPNNHKNKNDDETKRPNFVILLGDNLGYTDIGALSGGDEKSRTPNIDRLAKEGLQFEHWNSAAHLCSASRSALLTGRYPVRDGIYPGVFHNNAAGGLSPTTPTIASMLKEKGYATSIVGKWHLGHLPEYLPTKHGFDEWLGIPYHMSGGSVDGHVCHRDVHERMWLPLYHNETIIQQPVQISELADRYATQARHFIQRHAAKEAAEQQLQPPFFLYVPFSHVHQLCAPRDLPEQEFCQWTADPSSITFQDAVEEMDWIAGEIIRALEENGLASDTLVLFTSDNGPWLAEQKCSGKKGKFKGQWLMDNVSSDNCTACPHDYVPSPTTTDPHRCVLPNHKLSRDEHQKSVASSPAEQINTMVGVSCGHDSGLGSTWEANLRMPAFAWWPGRIAPGRVTRRTVSTLDVMPTFLSLAGGEERPFHNESYTLTSDFGGSDWTWDGMNLKDILLSDNHDNKDSVSEENNRVLFFWRDGFDDGPLVPPYGRFDVVALKMGHFKIWFYTKSGHYNDDAHIYHDPPLIFNVDTDPAEAHPLIMPDEFVNRAIKLRKQHMKEVSWGPPLTLAQDDDYIPCVDPLHNCRTDKSTISSER